MNDAIFLHPEDGDRVQDYETEEFENPLTGEVGRILKHKPNGECVYLDDKGCTIWEQRPAVCRTFDCRALVRKLGPGRTYLAVRNGSLSAEVVSAGLVRLKEKS